MIMPSLSWLYEDYGWLAKDQCEICGKHKPLSVFKANAYQKRGKHKKKYKVKACYRCYYGILTKKSKGGEV